MGTFVRRGGQIYADMTFNNKAMQISTSVFRKPTHTDKYLDFCSHHPMAHKVSVIRTLYKRARTLSSSPLQRMKEEKHIAQTLKRNLYPTRLIRRTRLDLLSHCQDKQRDKERPEPVARITLPYIQHLSEAIKRLLQTLNIDTSLCPHCTLRQMLVRPKDANAKESLSNVVYRIPCKNCDCAYVGQTKKLFGVRLKEHQRAVFTGDSEKSALAEHALRTGHDIDWNNATILASCKFLDQRLLLESWHVQCQRKALNREQGSMPSLYMSLMNSC